MATQPVKRKRIVRKLRNKFRLVVLNDQTFEERFSLRLSPMNMIVFGGTIGLSLITITLYLIAFTPLREYIPGYTDVNIRRNLVTVNHKADSLSSQMLAQDKYLANIMNVINDKIDPAKTKKDSISTQLFDSIKSLNHSAEDEQLRKQIESGDRYELSEGTEKAFSSGIGSYSFFTPLKGSITTKFNTVQKHYGIDIVAGPNEVIKSALDGTIIIADWTSETGYVIGVQHSNNLLTLYKHNSALMKNVGDYVNAGEVIAIIGNTGEYSSGPHLHFELWYNGSPVNPLDYMNF